MPSIKFIQTLEPLKKAESSLKEVEAILKFPSEKSEGSIIEILKSDFKLLILEATAIPAQPAPTIRTFECSIIVKD